MNKKDENKLFWIMFGIAFLILLCIPAVYIAGVISTLIAIQSLY